MKGSELWQRGAAGSAELALSRAGFHPSPNEKTGLESFVERVSLQRRSLDMERAINWHLPCFLLLYQLWDLTDCCRHSRRAALTRDLPITQAILQKHQLGIRALAFEVGRAAAIPVS